MYEITWLAYSLMQTRFKKNIIFRLKNVTIDVYLLLLYASNGPSCLLTGAQLIMEIRYTTREMEKRNLNNDYSIAGSDALVCIN